MGSYTNEATTEQNKSATPKTQVLEALTEAELALCECIHTAEPLEAETLSDGGRLLERLASLRRCMEDMRGGVLALQEAVKRDWPEK